VRLALLRVPLRMVPCGAAWLCLAAVAGVGDDSFGVREGGRIHLSENDNTHEPAGSSSADRECGRAFLKSKLGVELTLDPSALESISANEKTVLTVRAKQAGTSSKKWCSAHLLMDIYIWARVVGPVIMVADVVPVPDSECTWFVLDAFLCILS
jgi:hypothetical protein